LNASESPLLPSSIYRPLGGCGPMVSPFGLGTVKFGRNTALKYPQGFSLPTDSELLRLLNQARELGINFLDTAPAYGTSELRLGKLLKKSREDWIISTKVGEIFNNGHSTYDFSAKATATSLENSLRSLHTDYLDLVLVHCNSHDIDNLSNTDVISVLRRYQQKGYIGMIGASTHSVEGGLYAINELDTAMITYNLNETGQEPIISAAKQLNKGVLLKKVLSQGHTDNISQSLKFALAPVAVTSAIVGTINPEHLIDNVHALMNVIE